MLVGGATAGTKARNDPVWIPSIRGRGGLNVGRRPLTNCGPGLEWSDSESEARGIINRFRHNKARAPRLLAQACSSARRSHCSSSGLLVQSSEPPAGRAGRRALRAAVAVAAAPAAAAPAGSHPVLLPQSPRPRPRLLRRWLAPSGAVSQPAATSDGGAPTARVVDLALTGSNTTSALVSAGAFLLVGGLLVRASDSSRRLAPAGFPRRAAATAGSGSGDGFRSGSAAPPWPARPALGTGAA